MKTTLEIPDELFRRTKAIAALRGESLKDFVTAALRAHLEEEPAESLPNRGWRSVFGRARPEEVEEIDRIVSEELERIDPDAWR
ncbi:MAG TPA: hypothetical protein VHR45_17670 [Thermoanaerobaculia bacterium]|nr:hypothetical protein [Thermoanaerobaculia bacterium]